ncbi:GNAT family N-acetyltransferase [Alisedimentitalea sp. MJ-SS2]|uniref:GNAT family N-acetyltransferase n=1 Tax=Aliisedimentitalea sp. MJ-SS2 TaxID=3049795 RepID=UPI002907061C|nr:GNAT family N-acetyltransferase [Alisedimentitalea sp. MJ-SS2]MDU8929200.1 GNAT family N-acetyltransferase [Alisedimentitalea sp. MJ-SS2]
MGEISIRRLVPDDIGALGEMVGALARHHGDEPGAGDAELRRDCLGNDPWLTVWIADVAGTPVGYAACQRRVQMQFGRRGIELHHLFVDAARRGQGVGADLVGRVKEWAEREACEFVVVGTEPDNIRAQGFYLGLGFQQVALDGVRFWLPVGPR